MDKIEQVFPSLHLEVTSKFFKFSVIKIVDIYVEHLLKGHASAEEENSTKKSRAYNFIDSKGENLLHCMVYEALLQYSIEKHCELSNLISRDLIYVWEEFKPFFHFYCGVNQKTYDSFSTIDECFERINKRRVKLGKNLMTLEVFVELINHSLQTYKAITKLEAIRDLTLRVENSKIECSDPITFKVLSDAIYLVVSTLLESHSYGLKCFVNKNHSIVYQLEDDVSPQVAQFINKDIIQDNKDLITRSLVVSNTEEKSDLHFLQRFAVIFNPIEATNLEFFDKIDDYGNAVIMDDTATLKNKYDLNARLAGQYKRVSEITMSKDNIRFYLAGLNVSIESSEIETLAKLKNEFSKRTFPYFASIRFPLGELTSEVNGILSNSHSSLYINEHNIVYHDEWYKVPNSQTGELIDRNYTGVPCNCNIWHIDCWELKESKGLETLYDWFDAVAYEMFKHPNFHTYALHFDKFDADAYNKFVNSHSYTKLIKTKFKTKENETTLGDSYFLNNFVSMIAILMLATGKKILVQGLEGVSTNLIEKKFLHIYTLDGNKGDFGDCCTADIRFHLRVINDLNNTLTVTKHTNALTNGLTHSLGVIKQNLLQSLDITGVPNRLYSKFVSVKDFENNIDVGRLKFPKDILTSQNSDPEFYTICLSSTLTPYEKFKLYDFTEELTSMVEENRKLSHPSFFFDKDIDKSKGKIKFNKSRFRIIPVQDYLKDLRTQLELEFYSAENVEALHSFSKVLIAQCLAEDDSITEKDADKVLGELNFFKSKVVKTFKFSVGEFTGTLSEALDWIQAKRGVQYNTFEDYRQYKLRNSPTLGNSDIREKLQEEITSNIVPLNNETSLEQMMYTLCIFIMQACVNDYNSFVFLQDILVLEDTMAEDILGEETYRKYRKPLYLGFLRNNETYTADPFVTDELGIDEITPNMYDLVDLQIAQSESTRAYCACPPAILDECFEWYALSMRGDGKENMELNSFMCGYPHTLEYESCEEYDDGTVEVYPIYTEPYIKSRIYTEKILESVCLNDKSIDSSVDELSLRLNYEALGDSTPLEEFPEATHSVVSSALISNEYSLWAKCCTLFDTGLTQYFYGVLAHYYLTDKSPESIEFAEHMNWDESSYEVLNLDWNEVSIEHFSRVPVLHSMLEQYFAVHQKYKTSYNFKLPTAYREYFNGKIVSKEAFRCRRVLIPWLYVGSNNKYLENARPRFTYYSLRELKLFKNVRACGDAVSNFNTITLLSFKQPISDLEVDFKSLSLEDEDVINDNEETTTVADNDETKETAEFLV